MLQVFHGFSKNIPIEPKESPRLETDNDDESNVHRKDKFIIILFSNFKKQTKQKTDFDRTVNGIYLGVFYTVYICFTNFPLIFHILSIQIYLYYLPFFTSYSIGITVYSKRTKKNKPFLYFPMTKKANKPMIKIPLP